MRTFEILRGVAIMVWDELRTEGGLGWTWVGFLTIENKLNTAETIDSFFRYFLKMFLTFLEVNIRRRCLV